MQKENNQMTAENNRLDNGQFAKGNPGKPKGSSKNRLRDEIRNFLNDNWANFPEWFSELKPKEKIETMLDLMPYAVSRLQSISQTDDQGNSLEPKATIDYSRLSEATLKEILQNTTLDNEDPKQ